ncbi:MAG: DUF6597 domain-containing transcriptional factor [Flavobacteriales bacterium]
MSKNSTYQQFSPSEEALSEVIDSFWVHHNPAQETERVIIAPDSFFKMLVYVQNNKVVNYFKTGIWTEPKPIDIPPQTYVLGCRFNILAPEYLFRTEIAKLKNTSKQLDLSYLGLDEMVFENHSDVIKQWEKNLLKERGKKAIEPHKKRMAQAIYQAKGSLSASELSNQIFLTNRTINRYLNKYMGLSLKSYISIQRAFQAYIKIRKGELSPTLEFYDQSHYIREVKKYAGESPKQIFKGINDRFIQFRNIKQN